MTFRKKFENYLVNAIPNDSEYVKRTFLANWNQSGIRSYLIRNNITLSVNGLLEGKFSECKYRFSIASMLSEYCFLTYNNNWPSWNMKPYSYALLSDSKALIDKFASLPIDEHKIYDIEKKESPAYWNYLLKGLWLNDALIIDKGLSDLYDKNISKNREISLSRAHKLCTEGISERNEMKIIDGLNEFELKRNKKRILANDICENVISFFPIAYAKIAWLKGLEVDPQSKYMPLDLLRVEPLEEYTIPYWFLRDWYRDQSVDWRYEPIHPELQDWDNDPENPNRNKGGFFKKLFS